MTKNLLYVIAKRDFGVLFVRTNPLKVTYISHENIEIYQNELEENNDLRDGYAEIAGAAQKLLADIDKDPSTDFTISTADGVKELVRNRHSIHNTDYSFLAILKDEPPVNFNRMSYNPLANVWADLDPDSIDTSNDTSKDLISELLGK